MNRTSEGGEGYARRHQIDTEDMIDMAFGRLNQILDA